ncbi:RHS repeat-associated core domain-containing protein [Desulfobacterales bacterium HSG2]|nr:RHS repeat-associated core domain-containing protein [Desulfobacterales bacterium HSG2]
MMRKINCCIKRFALTLLLLVATSALSLAEVSFILPCNYLVELEMSEHEGTTAIERISTDFARIGWSRVYDMWTESYTIYRYRVWAEFDISALEGAVVSGAGFRVYNKWTFGNEADSWQYSSIQPRTAGSIDLSAEHEKGENLYSGGFEWTINVDVWTPETGFFEPNWDEHRRGNGNSLTDDLQAHISDPGKSWFAVELFDDVLRSDSESNDHRAKLTDILMKVAVSSDGRGLVPGKNLGRGDEDDESVPLTGDSINLATGNKYQRETDLLLSSPGLPMTFARDYNSQRESDSPFGYGWTGTFSESVTVGDNRMILRQADGAEVHFIDDGSGKYISETGRARVIEPVTDGWHLTEPNDKTLEFDSEGKLVRITERNGNTETLGYADGKLSYVEDNYGCRFDFAYNSEGRVQTLTTPVGAFIYTYGDQGNLTGVTRPDQTGRTYRYEDSHDPHNLTQIVEINNEKEISAEFGYDDQDRAVTSESMGGIRRFSVVYEDEFVRKITDSLGRTSVCEIQGSHGIGRIESCAGPCGSCPGSPGTEYDLTSRLQIEKATDAMGNVTIHTYDDLGNMLTKTEAAETSEERTTTYTYHPDFSQVASVTRESVSNPGEKTVASFSYDDAGNLEEIKETGYSGTDSVSRTTTLTYYDSGQIKGTDGPRTDVNDAAAFEYYPNESSHGNNRGMLKKITDPLGHTTLFSDYNAWGKPEKITDANNVETTFAYTPSGRLSSRTTAGYTTAFEYDDAGNLTTENLPGGGKTTYGYTDAYLLEKAEDNLGNDMKYIYDSEGNRTREEIHDESGVLKKYADFGFDDFNRPNKITYPGGFSEDADYDDNGNLTQTTDAGGEVTTHYGYDALNRRVSVLAKPANVITGFGYDSHDNRISMTDAESNTTASAYDDLGRAISVNSPDSGLVLYGYDPADNVVSQTDGNNITVTYQYDALNRLTDVQFPDSSQNITYGYDEGENGKGRLTSVTDPAGQTTYTYNALGQLTQETRITEGKTYITAYGYDPATGELGGMTYPSGLAVMYQSDDNGKVTAISGDGEPLITSVSYLPFGPVTNMTFGDNILTTARKYDERYLMTGTVSGTVMDYQYTRDARGNVASVSGAMIPRFIKRTTGYEHEGNRLIRVAGRQQSYDGHGNLISDGIRSFEYDQNNRLVKVSQNDVTLGAYSYDGRGRRVKKVASGKTVLFHYDSNGNLIAETDENGTPLRDVIYLNGERVSMKIYGDQTGIYYFLNDHIGTPHKIINASGEVVWEAAYHPFGEARAITETITNHFRFPGQYFDAETGLHYDRFRYYDPQTGRYLMPDAFGGNRYGYASNNPVRRIHAEGLEIKVPTFFHAPTGLPNSTGCDPKVTLESCKK